MIKIIPTPLHLNSIILLSNLSLNKMNLETSTTNYFSLKIIYLQNN